VTSRQYYWGVSLRLILRQRGAYLAFEEDGADAVEELERREDAALDQHTRAQRCRHPPSRAHGHLVEPLL